MTTSIGLKMALDIAPDVNADSHLTIGDDDDDGDDPFSLPSSLSDNIVEYFNLMGSYNPMRIAE